MRNNDINSKGFLVYILCPKDTKRNSCVSTRSLQQIHVGMRWGGSVFKVINQDFLYSITDVVQVPGFLVSLRMQGFKFSEAGKRYEQY